jgi:hypothetical protein
VIPRLLATVLALSLAAGDAARAADAYVIGFFAYSQVSHGSCGLIAWRSDLILHNPGPVEARVRQISVSNGVLPGLTTELVIPARQTITGIHLLGTLPGGRLPFLWVARLDMPDHILVQGRVEASPTDCGGTSPPNPPTYGAFSLPVIRSLTPPNTTKIHLGADLGFVDSYVNVGVYNASTEPANATVELRQACDDSLVDRRTVAIPAQTIVQIGGLAGPLTSCATGSPPRTSDWVRYVAVTVDRPSLSYVVSKMNELPFPPRIPYASPIPE